MPITGTFLADFTQFDSAVQGAGDSLRTLEGDAASVVTAADRMIVGMTNAGQASQASMLMIGGMSASGREAAASMRGLETNTTHAGASISQMGTLLRSVATTLGVTFSVASVINFTKEIGRAADELTKLSDRTGLSLQALQKFQIAGGDAGNTVDELSAAIVQLSDRLEGGDKSAITALNRLGLSLVEIQKLSPEERLYAVSDALRKIEDPAQQVNIAMDLFGRTGATVLPTLKRGFDDVRDSVVGMSDESIQSLDLLGDALGRTGRSLSAFAGEHLGRAVEGWRILLGELDPGKARLDALAKAASDALPRLAAIPPPGIPDDLDAIEQELTQNVKAMIELSEWAEKTAKAYASLQSEIANETGLAQMKAQEEAMARAAQNQEGLWLMERDAWQLQLKAREDAAAALEAQAAADAAMQAQLGEGLLVVGEYANANRMAGDVAKAATQDAVMGYAAVQQQVAMTGDAIRAYIDLQKYSAAANAILQENSLFTSRSQLERISRLPTGGGSGGATTVNVNVSGVWDPRSQDELRRVVSEGLTRSAMQGTKFS